MFCLVQQQDANQGNSTTPKIASDICFQATESWFQEWFLAELVMQNVSSWSRVKLNPPRFKCSQLELNLVPGRTEWPKYGTWCKAAGCPTWVPATAAGGCGSAHFVSGQPKCLQDGKRDSCPVPKYCFCAEVFCDTCLSMMILCCKYHFLP